MLRKITLNAEEELIQNAILIAQHQQTTLEAKFQQWLNRYIYQNRCVENKCVENSCVENNYTNLMQMLSHVQVGRTFTRDELNER